MNPQETHVVTGAFGYSGKYIAKRLLDAGHQVRTLTNSPDRPNPFGDKIKAHPFNFDDTEKLVKSLQGASVLYNTYWVRFNYKDFKHSIAVENTLKLFDAAKKAGVKRIVHVSITNPSEDSNLEYFSGKAGLERSLIESGISYAILRPTVLFGKEDILINNIAWVLRKLPVFGVFGGGNYRLQPIYVDDLAKLAVEQGKETENRIIDAIGPETFTYRELVKEIGNVTGKQRPIISIPDSIGYIAGQVIGKIVGDITITREEIDGLKADLLYTPSPPAGETRLTEWLRENASTLGKRYASELARRKNRVESYEKL
ncbi:MAG: NmrA family NAD(P)-binding protein [Candidatus Hydrothermarchaeaceae archaeon]